ncbi:OsmC family protein [Pseudorhodobacter turbinis]|uniref:OsmC family protein n=1 Tax=Pseudorhodobacter turbinis TaxID=2500533 RepID=A0A4P8EEC5_9RHOB|nr:OsmC family protein [Pseudorhodobacter turbinis]QCO55087.1 OsmC family protein [Pseudorhodobacter turbinis]
MALNARPRKFGPVFAIFDGSDTIQYAYRDVAKASAYPPTHTPVDTLLASLAACILKSVQWAAGQQNAALQPFSVRVEGVKALDDPSRVGSIEITVLGRLVADEALIAPIVEQAKSICTVSNTLNCPVSVTTEVNADA